MTLYTFLREPLNHIHQDTKSTRLIAVCKRLNAASTLVSTRDNFPQDGNGQESFLCLVSSRSELMALTQKELSCPEESFPKWKLTLKELSPRLRGCQARPNSANYTIYNIHCISTFECRFRIQIPKIYSSTAL